MKLRDKLRMIVQTAVSDLFSEDSHPTAPDRVLAQIEVSQARLDALTAELATAIARASRAEQAWQLAQAQNQPDTAELAAQAMAYRETAVSLQQDLTSLQTRLDTLRRQRTSLHERAANVATQEHRHTLHREITQTTDTLHHDLADQSEQIARREDHTAALDDIRARLSKPNP